MKVYLSGPMTGIPGYNFPAFRFAAEVMRGQGYEVVSPIETDGGDTSKPREYYLRIDIEHLLCVDAVAVLPGWQESEGARLEVQIAKAIGLPILNAENGQPYTETVLQEAERLVNGARRSHYGTPDENHGRTAGMWSAYLGIPIKPRDVCNLNILQKVSRDRHRPVRDNLADIAGYALNAELVS